MAIAEAFYDGVYWLYSFFYENALETHNLRVFRAHDEEPQVGWSSLLLAVIGATYCIGIVSGLAVPDWFQPTLAGALWGGLFVLGIFAARMHTSHPLSVFGALATGALLMGAFRSITDFGFAESIFVSTILVALGWLVARVDHYEQAGDGQAMSGFRRWSIADILFITSVSACLCQATPRIVSSPILFFSVLASLIAGIYASWVAYRWTWSDEWTVLRFLAIAIGFGLSIAVVYGYSPRGTSIFDSLQWILSGPVTVIASQGTTVLLLLSLQRFERRYSNKAAEPSIL